MDQLQKLFVGLLAFAALCFAVLLGSLIESVIRRHNCQEYHSDLVYKDAVAKCDAIMRGEKK